MAMPINPFSGKCNCTFQSLVHADTRAARLADFSASSNPRAVSDFTTQPTDGQKIQRLIQQGLSYSRPSKVD
ncbi:MAG: hypothetical protein HYV03_06210 [Deltaproteobacteria bacterium]|nr:hypothetical protein [Deltaproteobacteria bacterium]